MEQFQGYNGRLNYFYGSEIVSPMFHPDKK